MYNGDISQACILSKMLFTQCTLNYQKYHTYFVACITPSKIHYIRDQHIVSLGAQGGIFYAGTPRVVENGDLSDISYIYKGKKMLGMLVLAHGCA